MTSIVPYVLLIVALFAKELLVRQERKDGAELLQSVLDRIQDPERAVGIHLADMAIHKQEGKLKTDDVQIQTAEDGELNLVGRVIEGDFNKDKPKDAS